ncbi:MAG: hypothetical protein K5705_07725 [Oscillospiraceae bacterium]|nr:hypothetical protein [Oscillospiraceae bacterium]
MKQIEWGHEVIEAEVQTRIRKKLLRKFWLKVGAVTLIALILAIRLFGGELAQKLLHWPWNFGMDPNCLYRPHYAEPVNTGPNERLLEIMYEAAVDVEDSFKFDTDILKCNTADQVFQITCATADELKSRYPELFWISGVEPVLTMSEDGTEICRTTTVNFQRVKEFAHMPAKKMYRELKQEAKRLLDGAPKHGSDFDKALYVHDQLVQLITYDVPGSESQEYQLCHTVYGALAEHSAVCMGYSVTYQYLMRELGVKCVYAHGDIKVSAAELLLSKLTMKDNGHAWNWIELDRESYWVDVTWDDPLDENWQEISGAVSHEYCFVDDDKIFESRSPDDACKELPACRSMKLNKQLMEADS